MALNSEALIVIINDKYAGLYLTVLVTSFHVCPDTLDAITAQKWLVHNLAEANIDPFKYPKLGDQLYWDVYIQAHLIYPLFKECTGFELLVVSLASFVIGAMITGCVFAVLGSNIRSQVT